ncbi:hypothetical protein HAX54_047615 [Datura stramonium]|uniref:Uncharacterized protein n=1 Tax=Datura stramonium TaxID=4076 RepID=A0ABS8WIE9_DATST|nr:hypothetical protein [Datura stramonium]
MTTSAVDDLVTSSVSASESESSASDNEKLIQSVALRGAGVELFEIGVSEVVVENGLLLINELIVGNWKKETLFWGSGFEKSGGKERREEKAVGEVGEGRRWRDGRATGQCRRRTLTRRFTVFPSRHRAPPLWNGAAAPPFRLHLLKINQRFYEIWRDGSFKSNQFLQELLHEEDFFGTITRLHRGSWDLPVSTLFTRFESSSEGAEVDIVDRHRRIWISQVVLSYGAESDQSLGIPGEGRTKVNNRIKRRIHEPLSKAASPAASNMQSRSKELQFVFFRKPDRFLESDCRSGHVVGLRWRGQFLKSWWLKSVVYKPIPVDGLPLTTIKACDESKSLQTCWLLLKLPMGIYI